VRAAVVTGASSGIGEATVRRLADDGWRVLAIARREDRLRALAYAHEGVEPLAVDLTDDDAPQRVRRAVGEGLGALHLLVNNAGMARRAPFGDGERGGYENVRQTMKINFEAPVRLTEALLPVLRESAPSSIVNIGSVSSRIALPRAGAYAASKFAVAGWTDALRSEEAEHGVHVGLVLPGFVRTEGFPQQDLLARSATRWAVSTPERVAGAIVEAGPGGKAERIVPRPWGAVVGLRALAPGVVRRATTGFRR
jgi:short-subunit dehydrogenase